MRNMYMVYDFMMSFLNGYMEDNKVDRWFSTPNGKACRAVYSDDDYGIWEVIGHEDGALIEYDHFKGKFIDVVNAAVQLPKFFNPLYKMGSNIYRVAFDDDCDYLFKKLIKV